MAADRDREPEFTVTDRRKFNLDDVLSGKSEEAVPSSTAVSEAGAAEAGSEPLQQRGDAAGDAADAEQPEAEEHFAEGWESPSEADQHEQSTAYRESGRTLDAALDAQQPGLSQQIGAVSFERLVSLISMQALMLMGAVAPEGQQPRVDVVGARQQIDMLDLLKEKTKGNLTSKEQAILDNTLFELRMMFIEIMNAFAKGPKVKES